MKRAITASLRQVVRHQGPVLQLASCLRDGSLPCERPPLIPPLRTNLGQVGVLTPSAWLNQAQDARAELLPATTPMPLGFFATPTVPLTSWCPMLAERFMALWRIRWLFCLVKC